MSSTITILPMYLSFLRPLALPRAATLSRFLSTTTTKIPKTSSTIKASATAVPAPQSSFSKLTPESIAALQYRVKRTTSNSLPIYLLWKRGGNLHQTRLRKVEGNLAVLKTELQAALQLEEKDVVVNQLTKHIIIRGHRKADVARFLEERQF